MWPICAGLMAPLAGAGCNSCSKTTPYVPFLDETGPTASADVGVAIADSVADVKGPKFQAIRGTNAPKDAARWTLEGLALDAPAGQVIVTAIARDLDGDGLRDALVYVQPAAASGAAGAIGGGGELRFFRGQPGGLLPARVVGATTTSALEVALPTPCVGKPLLTMVGPHSVTLDLRSTCGEAAPTPRKFFYASFVPSATRAVARDGEEIIRAISFTAKILEPPTGMNLSIDVEALDQDGDGVDDPVLTFGLEGTSLPFDGTERVSAKMRFWDRPSGLSRDRREPEASFQFLAASVLSKASKKATAVGVASAARRIRLLYAGLCAESSMPWVDPLGEHGISCGSSRGLEELPIAEARAALTLGDLFTAVSTRERVPHGATTRLTKQRAELDHAINAAAPSLWTSLRELRALPYTPSRGSASWGALAFEKSGSLLIRTVTGVVRFDPASLEESDAPDVAAWPWEVSWPGKDARLTQVADACDAPWLAARLAGHDVATGLQLIPLPVVPILGKGRCSGGKGVSVLSVPVTFGKDMLGRESLFVFVQGEPMSLPLTLDHPIGSALSGAGLAEGSFVFGSPRSPSGAYVVLATRFGVLRREMAEKPQHTLLRTRDLEGVYLALRECAVSDSGARIACVREGRVVFMDAASPTTSPVPTPAISAKPSVSSDGTSL